MAARAAAGAALEAERARAAKALADALEAQRVALEARAKRALGEEAAALERVFQHQLEGFQRKVGAGFEDQIAYLRDTCVASTELVRELQAQVEDMNADTLRVRQEHLAELEGERARLEHAHQHIQSLEHILKGGKLHPAAVKVAPYAGSPAAGATKAVALYRKKRHG